MFELSIALKYLIPRRKQLSVSLIALMSVIVISLVVWLVLVFLSVTEGIEKNWLTKLTALNAPLRITPTEHYYSSYYYLADAYSSASHFTSKNIAQKASSRISDPYSPEEDAGLPRGFPSPEKDIHGQLKDPVKETYRILEELKFKTEGFAYQDFEIGGALLRLQLLRENKISMHQDSAQSFLTQVSYIASIPHFSPAFSSMLLAPSEKDLNHLFYLSSHTTELAREDSPSLTLPAASEKVKKRLTELLRSVSIQELKNSTPYWKLPLELLAKNIPFHCIAHYSGDQLIRIVLPHEAEIYYDHSNCVNFDSARQGQIEAKRSERGRPFPVGKADEEDRFGKVAASQNSHNWSGRSITEQAHSGKLWRENDTLFFQEENKEAVIVPALLPLFVEGGLRLQVLDTLFSKDIQRMQDIRFKVKATLQRIPLTGVIPWDNLEVSQAVFHSTNEAPWPVSEDTRVQLPINDEKETGVLLAKNYRDSGVMIGDRGYLSYNSATVSSLQEQRLPIFVAGFYDPGILSVGNRCILVPPFVTQTINASSSTFNLDKSQSNGILVWFHSVGDADLIKNILLSEFTRAGISPYWKVTTYKEYDFAKDLLQQFQSDKYLFSLVAAIILLVACCNIISLLTLLVNDKKREIGILQAMGASTKSIAWIFGTCGIVLGIISCLIGACAAVFTLKHIDAIVHLLSFLQGHDAFNAAFFGNSLPNTLSSSALQFIFLITPLLSLLAGLVPAIKACRMRPSEILRSE